VEETLRVSLTLELGGFSETTGVTAITSLITTENDRDMNMSSSTYGRINTTRSPMRELQIGVKFSF
jgi:hypothetical protein